MPSGPAPKDIPIVRLKRIDSTSLLARREARRGRLCDHPMVFIAERQVAGVGRFGRRWESPAGGVWMTLVLPAGEDVRAGPGLASLGLRIGVACRRAIAGAVGDAGLDVRLKWPNDVLIDGKKVSGVLTEIVRTESGSRGSGWYLLIGVGVNANVHVTDLAPEVQASATSLREALGRDVSLEELVASLLVHLPPAALAPGLSAQVLGEARANLFGVGLSQQISLADGTRITGVLRGLDDSGAPVFEVEGRPWTPPPGAAVSVIDLTVPPARIV